MHVLSCELNHRVTLPPREGGDALRPSGCLLNAGSLETSRATTYSTKVISEFRQSELRTIEVFALCERRYFSVPAELAVLCVQQRHQETRDATSTTTVPFGIAINARTISSSRFHLCESKLGPAKTKHVAPPGLCDDQVSKLHN